MSRPGNNAVDNALKHIEDRILVLAPTGTDTVMACRILDDSGLRSRACVDVKQICLELRQGAGALLITDETLSYPAVQDLLKELEEQEPWSDIPAIVFPTNVDNAELLLEGLGAVANVTLLERPVRIAILLNAVKSALRARHRQYQARDLLRQLEEADRQKDVFLAMLSHELRTPLTAVVGWVRILQSGKVDSEKVTQGLEVINRNALTQMRLISDILSVSQMVAGKLQIERLPVQLDEIITAIVDSMRPDVEAHGLALKVALESHAAVILGDESRLQQIIANLLTNSIKFTPSGGRIDIRLKEKENRAEITVADNGEGIAQEFLPHIFERFRQADNTSTRSHGGLGLGLAITRHLVELHGGSITVHSLGKGLGAAFTITLPLVSVEVPAATKPTLSINEQLLDGVHVLVVDDDEDTLVLLQTLLSQHGAQVTAVSSVNEALAAVNASPLDILVSDISMPRHNGYELIQNVLAMNKCKDIPAIAVTGYASKQDRERVLAAGFRAHISKPFDPEDLVREIKTAIQNRRCS